MLRVFRLLLPLLVLAPVPAVAQSIDHIEPPNWWVGMRWNEVQLMVYGADLDGVTATFDDPGLQVTAVHTLQTASYAFVDVSISPSLDPGTYTLTLTRGTEEARAQWTVEARPDSAGRYAGYSSDDVVYLITPDRFANGDPSNDAVDGYSESADRTRPGARHGGDLQGIIDRLDYLADLGVTTLWLNPVLENAGRSSYHGYAATDLFRIDPRFGTNALYRTFVEEAHARGLKVVFDHVNNHIGIAHPWLSDLPRASWLNGSREDHLRDQHYKFSLMDAYGDPQTAERLTRFWFVGSMPDVNQTDPFVANYLIQNTLWWIEYSGIDGIREDTYPYPDQAFMARWAAAVLDEYPAFNIVGEIWETPPAYLASFQHGSPVPGARETNLPSVMDFALTEAMRGYIDGRSSEGPSLQPVYSVLTQDYLYADPSNLMTFIDNHDMSRAHYIGREDPRRVDQMLAFLLTTRGTPQLLYGMELGAIGGPSHVELRIDFPGGFPGDTRDAFTLTGRTPEERRVFDLTRSLLDVRRRYSALRGGELIHYPPTWGEDIYRYIRRDEDSTVLVILNGEDEAQRVSLDLLAHQLPEGARFVDLITGERFDQGVEAGIPMEVAGFRILQVE